MNYVNDKTIFTKVLTLTKKIIEQLKFRIYKQEKSFYEIENQDKIFILHSTKNR